MKTHLQGSRGRLGNKYSAQFCLFPNTARALHIAEDPLGFVASWISTLETTALSPIHASAISTLGASLFPKIDTSWIERLDVSLPRLGTSWFERLSWLVQQHVRGLPPNWGNVESLDTLDDDKLRSIILDEGIPLAA